VAALLSARGLTPRADTPNLYARGLIAEIRSDEPGRLCDALLVAAFIEARSHERLAILARGFAADGEETLGNFYGALATAEERHAATFLELCAPLVSPAALASRRAELAVRETEILASLPHAPRVH